MMVYHTICTIPYYTMLFSTILNRDLLSSLGERARKGSPRPDVHELPWRLQVVRDDEALCEHGGLGTPKGRVW